MVGCGAIGLAVIAALKAQGIGPVIASDPSPFRRTSAEKMGADVVVDPNAENPMDIWNSNAPMGSVCVVVECVGAPGVLNEILITAPWSARVIVAGQNLDDEVLFYRFSPHKRDQCPIWWFPNRAGLRRISQCVGVWDNRCEFWQTGHVDLDGAVDVAESTDTERHTRIAVYPNGKESLT